VFLSLLLTVVPAQPTPAHQVTHARLLDDGQPIVLAEEPMVTRKQLQTRELELMLARPDYQPAVVKMVGGTGLVALGMVEGIVAVEGGPLFALILGYLFDTAGLVVGVGLFAIASVVVGIVLIVAGISDAVATHRQRQDIDAQLAEVRSELTSTPVDASAGKTVPVVRF